MRQPPPGIWLSIVLVLAMLAPNPVRPVQAQSTVSFPVTQTFRTSAAPGWQLLNNASLTASSDGAGNGWLRLTSVANDQKGTAILNTPFSSSAGVLVRFTYATYGGNGADGMSFFLLDGSTVNPSPGGSGGALGYAKNGNTVPGLTNAYVGIGFDEFGNFASDAQLGIIGNSLASPNHITMRGSGNGLTGYSLLTKKAVSQGIATGSRNGARQVEVLINNGRITVKVNYGSGFVTEINEFNLASASGQAALPATLKMGFSAATGGNTNYHEIRDVTVTLPADLSTTLSASKANAARGEAVVLTATVRNSNDNAVSGATFLSQSPALSYGSWTCTASAGSTCPASGNGALSANVDLARGGSATFTINATLAAGASEGSNSLTAQINLPSSFTDIDPTSNQASVNLTAPSVFLIGSPSGAAFVEDGPAQVVAPNLVINSGTTLRRARVTINTNYQQGADALAVGSSTAVSGTLSGLAWAWDAANATLTITGDGSDATYQSVLRQVTFRNNSQTPTSARREVRFSLGDGLQFAGNGHFYEFVATRLTWQQASDAASARRYFGLQGYLPTILSQAEADFVLNKLGGQAAWIGARDLPTADEWRWVTGPEGREDAGRGRIFSRVSTPVNGQYVNWNANEPNHAGSGSVGYFIGQGCSFPTCVPGKWDDVAPDSVNDGYVVEYGGLPNDPTVTLAGTAQVTVTPVNDAPTAISLSPTSVGENLPPGTLVGTLSATDPDHTSGFTYALVDGDGGIDKSFFTIIGNQLQTARTFDFELRNSYSVRVQVTDPQGGTFARAFPITITKNALAPTFHNPPAPRTGVYGNPYQFAFNASGEPAPTFSISAGALPPGLTLNPTTGMLSGTLTTPGSYTFTVQAAVTGVITPATQVVTMNVTQAPLTVRANDLIVKQTNPVTLSYTVSGFKGADDEGDLTTPVQISSSGDGTTLGNFPISVAGATSPKYAITFVTGTLTVQARDLPTVTWNPAQAAITYGTPLSAAQLNAVVTDPNTGQPLPGTLTYIPTLGTVLNTGLQQRLTLVFTPTDTTNFVSLTTVKTIDVIPALLTVRADDKTIYVGNPLPTLTASYSGFVNGDDLSDLDVLASLSTPPDTNTVGNRLILVSGAADPNYFFSYQPGTLAILSTLVSPQIVTPAPPAGIYGQPYSHAVLAVGTPPTMTYTLTGTLPPGLSFNAASGRLSGTPNQAGTYAGLTLTADNGIAPSATSSYTITIAKAPLTVTADNLSKKQGAANPSFTMHYAGFVLGDDVSDLTSAPLASTSATAGSPVGAYPITLTGGTSANYAFTLVDGLLTVTDQDVPVATWNNPAAISYGTSLSAAQLNATATCNGTPLTNVNAQFLYNPSLGSVLDAGQAQRLEVTIVPRIATCATITKRADLDVSPVPLTITAPSLTIAAGTALPALTPSFTGLVNNDSGAGLATPPALTTAANKNVAGSYPVLVAGAADPNYAPITYVNGTLTVQPTSATGGVSTGGPGSVFPYTAGGFTPGQPVTLTVNGKTVGTYTAGPDGTIGAAVIFDPLTPSGIYTITATGAPAGTTTTQPVTITSSTPPLTQTQGLPPVAARPVAPGSVVPLLAGGFQPGEQVVLTVNGRQVGTLTAGPTGQIRPALDLVSGVSGTRQISLTGQTSGHQETAQVTVDPNGPTVVDPTAGYPGGPPIIGVTPGGPGSFFPVIFGGFQPGQTVPITVDGKLVGSVTAGPTGVAQATIYLDPHTQPGQHIIQAGPTGPLATVTVAPDAPALPRLNNAPVLQNTNEVGAPGGFFPFTGSGFQPGEDVLLTRNGVVIGSTKADATGNIQVALRFNSGTPPGNYLIDATGTTSGLRTSTTMTLDPNGPQRHNPGNLPVVSATSGLYLPFIAANFVR